MYDYAQTFFVDRQAVKGSLSVNLSKVDLYIKRKPKSGGPSEENRSGLIGPGITVSVVRVKADGTPDLSSIIESSYLSYNKIKFSGDASQPTSFLFPKEVYMATGKSYAIYIRCDGSEDYEFWTNKKGGLYVGTNTTSPGDNNNLVGNLFKTSERQKANVDSNAGGGTGKQPGISDVNWTPIYDEDLMFEVFVARYRDSGAGVDAVATTLFNLTPLRYDYFFYDAKHSLIRTSPNVGEHIFQLNPLASNNGNVYTVSVQKGNSTIKSNTVKFSDLITSLESNVYIVFVSAGHNPGHPSGDANLYSVCDVVDFGDDYLTLGKKPTFTNSVANFFISPVGTVEMVDTATSFSNKSTPDSWYWPKRKRQDVLVIENLSSNINSRFVNNSIQSITISANGGGYSNTDYIEITGPSGSANAYANVRTNASGNLTSVFLTKGGHGMLSTPSIAVKNSVGGTSSGSGATFSLVEGPWLKSEIRKYIVKDLEVMNFEVDAITPTIEVDDSPGTSYEFRHQLAYIKSGSSVIINPNATSNQKVVKNDEKNKLDYTSVAAVMSWSNELVQRQSVTGNSVHMIVKQSSNNDYIGDTPKPSNFYYHRFLINNDYTNEHTSFGNARAKHISTKISFQRMAEDAVVIMRAYKPPGTDFKVYAKLHNSIDSETFDDKDWTLMEVTSGKNQTSSISNKDDIKEFIYGIPLSPNTTVITTGTVNLESDNSTVVGVGTNFKNEFTGVKAGDLVKIYDPLFADSKYFIASVNSVTNATNLVLDSSTSNSSLLGTGLKLAKLGYKNQAFRNLNNENVVRYYNTSMHTYDGYDTMAIKVVMLSNSSVVIPEIDDLRAIGVSQ